MDVEPIKNKPLDSSHASFPAHPPVEAAEVPPPPRQDVPPKATDVALSLMKPGEMSANLVARASKLAVDQAATG